MLTAITPLRNNDFLLLQSSCSILIGFCSSFDSLQNSQILDLSVFVPQPFLLSNSLCSSLSVLWVSLFNCSRQHIAKSFTQKSPLSKGSGYAETEEHSAMPTQYVALAQRSVPHIFLDIYYIRAHGNLDFKGTCLCGTHFARLGLTSLAQLTFPILQFQPMYIAN